MTGSLCSDDAVILADFIPSRSPCNGRLSHRCYPLCLPRGDCGLVYTLYPAPGIAQWTNTTSLTTRNMPSCFYHFGTFKTIGRNWCIVDRLAQSVSVCEVDKPTNINVKGAIVHNAEHSYSSQPDGREFVLFVAASGLGRCHP